MNQALEMIVKPRTGLLYFDKYTDLVTWLSKNLSDIQLCYGIYNKSSHTVKFPNGNILILGYGDINKYISCEFMFVLGCPDLQWRVRI